jgi:hypothetical protein
MKLTRDEAYFVKKNEDTVGSLLSIIEHVRRFKIDDVLIAFYADRPIWMKQMPSQIVNSYGAPKKYKVIVVDTYGVPYVREINKSGNPSGKLIPMIKYQKGGDAFSASLTMRFEVDPDYTDAIILDDVESFDASTSHKEKASTFKEISTHNKNAAIDNGNKDLATEIDSMNVGDILWRSSITFWIILSKIPIPRDAKGKIIDASNHKFMEVQTSKGKILKLSFSDIKYKVLYNAQPRSFRELKDPK